jgi:chromosome segregation ATPase
MQIMQWYLCFRRSAESSALEAENLKKKLEDAEAEIKQLQEVQNNGLFLSGERITLLEAQSTEAHSRIQELENELAAERTRSNRLLTDYSVLKDEANQIKERHAEVELQCRATKYRISLVSEELQEA